MNALPRLLSVLLIACVALLGGGAAWSDTQVNKAEAKPAVKAVPKKAKKPKKKAKHAAKAPALKLATLDNPYLPGPNAPNVATPNPYLPGVTVTTAGAPNPYVSAPAAIAPVVPLILAKSLSSVPLPAATVEPGAAPRTLPTPAVTIPAVPVAPAVAVAPAARPAVAAATTAAVIAPAAPAPVGYVPRASSFNAYAPASAQPVPTAFAARAPVIAAYAPAPAPAVAAAPAKAAEPVTPWTPSASPARPVGNPYLVNSVAYNQTGMTPFQTGMAPFNPVDGLGQLFNDLRSYLPEPHLPSADISILPSIKKVFPTGEKPLYVLTFKCPTELIGITPLPTKALRWLLSSGMDALNSSDLLPFNMQQVCQ